MTAAFRLAAPAEADSLAAEGAFALSQALGSCRKAVALRLGRSVDVVDRYLAADPSSPVNRFVELMLACEFPFALVVHAQAVATRWTIRKETTRKLVARFHDVLQMYEPQAQAEEDAASQSYYAHRDLLKLAAAHKREALLQIEFDSLCYELQRRKVDPLEGGPVARPTTPEQKPRDK